MKMAPVMQPIQPSLVAVSGGRFLMGSTDGDENERPVHEVALDAFELGAFQVTNREYALFDADMRREPGFDAPDQPVVAVSWFDAVRYCEWLSAATGRPYRLPCEAEWEFAARGGLEGRRYPWGDEAPVRPSNRSSGPEPVGRNPANGFGLYDMCENVHEWCSDWFAADSYLVSAAKNPRGPELGSRRVSRGGSWRHHVRFSRCAARSSLPPELRYADYGFRIACGIAR